MRRRRLPKYRHGFLARYVRHFALRRMDHERCSQGELAQALGIPADSFSMYLTRQALPSPERLEQLLELGCDEPGLRDAWAADQLSLWMQANGISVEQLERCSERIVQESQQATPGRPPSAAVATRSRGDEIPEPASGSPERLTGARGFIERSLR